MQAPVSLCADTKHVPIVSVLALIGNPRKFDGKNLTVTGWLYLERSKQGVNAAYLFPSPSHLEMSDFPSAMDIDARTLQAALKADYRKVPLDKVHGGYVMLRGTFSGQDNRKVGLVGPGSLSSITKIDRLVVK